MNLKCRLCKSKNLICEEFQGVYRFDCQDCGLYFFIDPINDIILKKEKKKLKKS